MEPENKIRKVQNTLNILQYNNKSNMNDNMNRQCLLSKLNKDELIQIIMLIDESHRKSINVMNNAFISIGADLKVCEDKDCQNFSINNIYENEQIFTCARCNRFLCRKHALNVIFAGICNHCMYKA